MTPNGKADLAHHQAADWVMGTLGPDEAAGFRRHLTNCPHCQAAVAEFGRLGQMLQHLPPVVEPPPGLEARVIASVLAAAAEDRTATEVHHVPGAFPAAAGTSSPTQVVQIPAALPDAGADERPGGGMAKAIRFPRWHGRAGLHRLQGAVAAAVIAAAIVVLPHLGGGQAVTFKLHSPPGQAVASGAATARLDPASGSWDVTLSVQHLTNTGDKPFYECWYVTGGLRVSVGTFLAGNNGPFPMTSAVDPSLPHTTMEITLEYPSTDGARRGRVVLTSAQVTFNS